MSMLLRLLVALACYILSGYGIRMSGMLIKLNSPITWLIVYAWGAHLVLCLLWVCRKQINWPLAITGTLAGCACLVAVPIGFLFVFPSVLLAVHIIRTYQRERSSLRAGSPS